MTFDGRSDGIHVGLLGRSRYTVSPATADKALKMNTSAAGDKSN
jgi:hypothetical protein